MLVFGEFVSLEATRFPFSLTNSLAATLQIREWAIRG